MSDLQDEQRRIAEVYGSYRDAGHESGKWSPSNPGNAAILQERMGMLLRMLRSMDLPPLASSEILEIGCGAGQVIGELLQHGAEAKSITGLDLLEERLVTARAAHPAIRFLHGNASKIPLPDQSFDLVLLFTVFSSILDERLRNAIAIEIDRVLRRGGAVAWYDFRFNNPWNPHVRGIDAREVASYFPGYSRALRSVTLLPPLARRLGRATATLYPALSRISLLRSHYLGVLLKK